MQQEREKVREGKGRNRDKIVLEAAVSYELLLAVAFSCTHNYNNTWKCMLSNSCSRTTVHLPQVNLSNICKGDSTRLSGNAALHAPIAAYSKLAHLYF